jgi:hypothetical protein
MESIAINVLNETRTIIGTLDVNDADVNIVYQFADIRDPEKRKANYVRKFKLPGTKNNNKTLHSFHELGYMITDLPQYTTQSTIVISGAAQSFNPNRKLIAQVIVNDNVFFEGSMQLNKVNNDDGAISYEVTIYGGIADFFTNIGDLKLTDLDISEYNHKLTADNILQSQWVDSGKKEIYHRTAKGYTSPFTIKNIIKKNGIDYENYLGEGYVYPLIYGGGSDLKTTTHIEKWAPSIYVYTIWKKIFEKAGFRFRSNFIETDFFKRLIIPFSKDSLQITQEQQEKSEFLANVGNTTTGGDATYYTYITTGSSVFSTNTSTPVKFDKDTGGSTTAIPLPTDPGNVFTNSTTFTAAKDGKFRLQASLTVVVGFLTDQVVQSFVLKVNNSSGEVAASIPIKAKFINASTNAVIAEKSAFIAVTNAFYSTPVYFEGPLFLEWEGQLAKGTQIQIILEHTNTKQVGNAPSLTYNLSGQYKNVQQKILVKGKLTDSSNFSATLTDLSLNNGDDINMNQVLPDMSAQDFLVAVNRLFNLYWVPTGKDREFAIEPKDDIFAGAKDKIYDWTDMVDREETISIEPLFNLVGNKYKWSYTEDGDYLNKKYQEATDSIFGEREIIIDNDFLEDMGEIKTKFSPTPLYSPPSNPDISLSGIFSQDGVKFKRATPKPRILYWGGMMPYKAAWKDNREITIDSFGAKGEFTGGWVYLTTGDRYIFPYAGHLDNPYTPTLDLNYGLSSEYYHNYISLTDDNLYNKYWRSTAEEILNPTQHLLTATLNISTTEISTLDLRATIQYDNIYYRINKITYNPLTEIAEIELFKTFTYNQFTPTKLESGQAPQTAGTEVGVGADPTGTTKTNTGKDIWNDPWNGGGWTPWNETTTSWVKGNEWFNPVAGNQNRPQWNSFNDRGRGSISAISTLLPKKVWTSSDQYDNFYPNNGAVMVNGKWNNVASTAQYISINGSNNTVADAASNITIAGNYNTVLEGVTNVSIIGDRTIVRKSNVSYVNGTEISKGGVNTAGQVTVIKSPTTIWDKAGVIIGGKNSNGTFVGRTSPIIDANAPRPVGIGIGSLLPPPQEWENNVNPQGPLYPFPPIISQ